MTDMQSDEKTEPMELEYLEVADLAIIGGTARGAAHIFLSVSVLGPDGELIKVTYGVSPWEAIRLGISLGQVAIDTVEAAIESLEPTPPTPSRLHSPYL